MKKDLLLEIDVEELPVGYVRQALEMLKNAFLKEFKGLRISHGEAYVAGTAKMLICMVKGVSIKQDEIYREILGPSKETAFDKDGKPTKQAIGFAKSQGIAIEDLTLKSTNKGEYVFVRKKIKTQFTKDILKEIVPRNIKEIYFPKTMRWDDSGLRFARPIESVTVLFGNENIGIKIGNVPQRFVRGFTASRYLARLEKDCLVAPDKRKEKIRSLILNAINKLNGDKVIDEALLEEVNFMVSAPVIFTGEFDKKFLALPEDVLKASMSKYQRIFPVSKNSKLLNKFIAVIEGNRRDISSIRKNYESILEARLKDGLFFFNEDTKIPFSENVPKLKDLIFQKDLGSMFEKIQRLKALCSFICERIDAGGSLKNNLERAAELSKADLVTHMVGEFPSLQGIMGREYALNSGENKEVTEAIGEHYLPQGADDRMPESLEGAVLSISDKIDNVIGFLGMGVDISGSFDPFGIRRNTQGFIQIIREKSLRLSADELIQKTIELYGKKLSVDPVQLKNKLTNYIKERIGFLSGEKIQPELKEAVLAAGFTDIVDAFERIELIFSISKQRYFLETAKVVERTSNILKDTKEKIGTVDERLFKEDLEKEVWKVYLNSKDRIRDFIYKRHYKEATKEYAQVFFKILHDFFDKVLVNVEDASLRQNRLAMMKAINTLYTERVADLARLPQIVVR
jgi:glycyl-tRNA synthetase beta chain